MPTVATHIETRPNRAGQTRAYIAGTRVRVQDVAMLSERQGMSADEIVRGLRHLSLGQVYAALSYYFDHRDAILNELREDEEFVRQYQAAHPATAIEEKLRLATSSGLQDAIPSR